VPFLIKPLILVISGMITIGFFIDLSPGHILRAMAAGGFFILCQFLIFIFLLRKFWEATFFQVIKQFLFQNY
jgi:hypothetical protein